MNKLIIALGALLVVVVVAFFLFWSQLDKIIAGIIEETGTQTTKTGVTVESVQVADTIGEGKASINGLVVQAPAGYQEPNIFSLGVIAIDIDTGSLDQSTHVIKEILIKAPEVTFEVNEKGVSNFDALRKNIPSDRGKEGGQGPASEETPGDRETRLIINRLIIEEGKIRVRIPQDGDETKVTDLPRIELRDIGKKSGGATPEEVAQILINAIMEKALPAITRMQVNEKVGKDIEKAKSKLKGVFGGFGK